MYLFSSPKFDFIGLKYHNRMMNDNRGFKVMKTGAEGKELKSKSGGLGSRSRLDSNDDVSSPNGQEPIRRLTIDEAIDNIPIGLFHYRLLALCGSSFLADAAEVNLLAFVSVCAGVDWNLPSAQIASITSSVFAGQFFGGLFWGPVADYIGRKKAFQLVVTIISVCGFCSSFSPNYFTLIILRMMAGFGIGGLTVPFDLLAEFVPSKKRGEYLMKMEYFWTLGSLFVSSMAWALLSKYGWRTLTMINSTPTIIVSIIGACFIPESPRWLLEVGRKEEAVAAVRSAMETNGLLNYPNFELIDEEHLNTSSSRPLTIESPLNASAAMTDMGSTKDTGDSSPDGHDHADEVKSIKDLIMMHVRSYANLMKRENFGFSYPLWLTWFTFGFAYYGVILFVARIYDNADTSHDNQGGHDLTCNFDYKSIFINASAELVGIFLVVNFIEVTGRTIIAFVTFTLAAATSMVMGASIGPTAMLCFSLVARASSVAANSTTWVLTPELYKTSIRGTGHSSCNGVTRIGAFLSPFVVQSTLPNIFVSSLLFVANFIGVLCSMCLPETLGRSIEVDIPVEEYPKVFLFGGVPRTVLVAIVGPLFCYEGDKKWMDSISAPSAF